jgi:AAA15 family ATPase/GTPase
MKQAIYNAPIEYDIMKITKMVAKNILSFGEEGIRLEDLGKLNFIVGPNNSGKTNIFRVITQIRKMLNTFNASLEDYYYNGDSGKEIKVELEVKFDKEEIAALTSFMVCLSFEQISRNAKINEYRPLSEALATKIKEISEDIFGGSLRVNLSEKAGSFYGRRMNICFCRDQSPGIYFEMQSSALVLDSDLYANTTGYSPKEMPELVYEEMIKPPREQNARLNLSWLISKLNETTQKAGADAFQSGIPLGAGVTLSSYANITRSTGAPERCSLNLIKFLKNSLGRNAASFVENPLYFQKLIGIIFDSFIVNTENLRSAPESILEGNFESIPQRLNTITGADLPRFLYRLKNSSDKTDRTRYSGIHSKFKDICDLEFDIGIKSNVVLEDGQAKNETVNIYLDDGEKEVPLKMASAGAFELLLLLSSTIGIKDSVILLDEPALNLHPNMQRKLLGILKSNSEENDNQLFIITHSPYLITVDSIKSMWRVYLAENNDSAIFKITDRLGDGLRDRQAEFQFNNVEIRSLLFSHGVLFVEGPTDKCLIEEIDSQLLENIIQEREWSIIDMGGKNKNYFIEIAKLLKTQFLRIEDTDRSEDIDSQPQLNNNILYIPKDMEHLFDPPISHDREVVTCKKIKEKFTEGSITENIRRLAAILKEKIDRTDRGESTSSNAELPA